MNLLNPLSTQHSKVASAGAANAKSVDQTEGEQEGLFGLQLQQASSEQASVTDLKSKEKNVDAGDSEAADNTVKTDVEPLLETENSELSENETDESVVTDEVESTGAIATESTTQADEVKDEGVDKAMLEGADFLQRLNQSNQQISNQSVEGGKALPLNDDGAKDIEVSEEGEVAELKQAGLLDSLKSFAAKQPTELTDKEKALLADAKGNEQKFVTNTAETDEEAAQQVIAPELKKTLSGMSADQSLNKTVLTSGKTAEVLAAAGAMENVKRSLGEASEKESSLAQPLSAQMGVHQATNMKMEPQIAAAQVQTPLLLTKEQAGEQISERINMMMAKNLKQVDIRLDPPELGKIQIKLTLNQDQASVQFTVNNSQTRDMVEHAMPRLREMMHQQGLQLAQGSVSQDNSSQFAQQQFTQQQQSDQQTGSSSEGVLTSSQEPESDKHLDAIEMFVTNKKDRVDYYA
ncbi:flagellar hook-length control protein FliK [Photobacterium leiognathi subsp. mandapamensis]|uniref:flagellar hook-length control protein FliK n=1 Tax=Photobacterium leiognathi TaxID=553611 RepID=UPI000D17C4DF|nr:flagellar hook-length control protein FliK [Photobacterium leiognathi]PSW65850.1 flagellar hook-length control protein FliK [Photobacterium leiognathi subsp. mandapamensis]